MVIFSRTFRFLTTMPDDEQNKDVVIAFRIPAAKAEALEREFRHDASLPQGVNSVHKFARKIILDHQDSTPVTPHRGRRREAIVAG